MDCRETDVHDLTISRDASAMNAGTTRQRALNWDWKTVLTSSQRKAQAREREAKTADPHGAPNQAASYNREGGGGGAQERLRRKPKYRRLPPPPRDDIKVIVRPHQGLSIKTLTSPTLADAVIAACGGLIKVSTPHQEVAEKVSRIASLTVNGRPHAVNAYEAAGESAIRGVIHGFIPHTASEEVKANLTVHAQGVQVLQARMLADTKTAVIPSCGGFVPRCVYYTGAANSLASLTRTPRKCAKSVTTSARDPTCAPNRTPQCAEPVACGTPCPVTSEPQVRNLRARSPHGRSQLQEEAQAFATHSPHNFKRPHLAPNTREYHDEDGEAPAMVQLGPRRF
ncbi:hypothetical protein HPB49_021095 [Dermacentor silvarum]|uniref:Uncharacterized protein n=1 Tax=Dermacentor silvarum TaxID=543639 RepID=A0ACB8CZQ1_DERSI|nr:hypothetical protein HPB49_021095 [Dermacentor silvarum]